MVVVAGANGNTGQVVAESLLAQGKRITVLVRDASKGERWTTKGAVVVVSALEDADRFECHLVGSRGSVLFDSAE